MSFQTYLDNIKAKTGQSPAQLHAMALDVTEPDAIAAFIKGRRS